MCMFIFTCIFIRQTTAISNSSVACWIGCRPQIPFCGGEVIEGGAFFGAMLQQQAPLAEPIPDTSQDAQLAREFAANGQFCDDTDIPLEHDGRFAIWAQKMIATLKQEAANQPAVKPAKMNSRNRAKAAKAALEAKNHTTSAS